MNRDFGGQSCLHSPQWLHKVSQVRPRFLLPGLQRMLDCLQKGATHYEGIASTSHHT